MFIRRYDSDGNDLWTRSIATDRDDFSYGVAVNADGVFLAGATRGALPGHVDTGGTDAFVARTSRYSDAELIQQLIDKVLLCNVPAGLEHSLEAKLRAALSITGNTNENSDGSSIALLQAFITTVENDRGRGLTREQADELLAFASNIISVMGAEDRPADD